MGQARNVQFFKMSVYLYCCFYLCNGNTPKNDFIKPDILLNPLQTDPKNMFLVRKLSTKTVSSELEFIDALDEYTEIELVADINISVGIKISKCPVRVYGNQHIISGQENGMDNSCLSIDCASPSNVSFEGVSVLNCGSLSKYTSKGGAMIIDGNTTVSVSNCSFKGNIAENAGAIYVVSGASLVVANSTIQRNRALVDAGAIASYGWLVMRQSSIIENLAGNNAGGLFHQGFGFSGHELLIADNTALFYVGGLIVVGALFDTVITNSKFISNSGVVGGALGCFGGSNVQVTWSSFILNRASFNGGAIKVGTQSTLLLSNCNITSNDAPAGGGFAISDGYASIDRCNFFNNSATSLSTFTLLSGKCSVGGGCFSSNNSSNALSYADNQRCIFQANANGSLDVEHFITEPNKDILTLNGVNYSGFDGPQCVDVRQGDLIQWHSNSRSAYSGFEICYSEVLSGGGALYLGSESGMVSLSHSHLIQNSATKYGGTIQNDGGDYDGYDNIIIPGIFDDLAPINVDSGSFTSYDLSLTGSIDGANAGIVTCDSSCGPGYYGVCSSASSKAPSCKVNCHCVTCEAGTYSSGFGSSSDTCEKCPNTYNSTAGSSSCTLAEEGFYLNTMNISTPCPDHNYCVGAKVTPIPLENYWVDRSSLDRLGQTLRCVRSSCVRSGADRDLACWVQECYGHSNSCPSKCNTETFQCTKGARGPLCGSCDDDHVFSTTSQTCVACSSSLVKTANFWVFISFLILIALGASSYYYVAVLRQDLFQNSKLAVTIEHMKSELIHYSDNGTIRVLVVNFQILHSISWTLEIEFPEPFSKVQQICGFLAFDFTFMNCLSGNFLISTVRWSVLPILLGLLNELVLFCRFLQVSNWVKGGVLSSPQAEALKVKLNTQHFSFLLIMLFLILPPVSRLQFVSLDCFNLNGNSLLRVDSMINCDSSEYQLYRALISVFITLYLCIPLYWLLLLHRRSDALNPGSDDCELVYYLRNNEVALAPLRFLFLPYQPKWWFFESIEMYRRIAFIGVLPLLSSHPDRRSAIGMLLSLCSLEVFRNIEPFRDPITNLIFYVSQYVILLTFGVALAIQVQMTSGISGFVIGVVLLIVNLLVIAIVIVSASVRYLEAKTRNEILSTRTTAKVEWAVGFSAEKFMTTFESIAHHSVPPSCCLGFYYTSLVNARKYLKSGIPIDVDLKVTELVARQQGKLANLFGNSENGGIVLTLNKPVDLDAQDLLAFPVREVILVCAVPRRWLNVMNVTGEGETEGRGLHMVLGSALAAIQGITVAKLGLGTVLLPKSIYRAYQIAESEENSPMSRHTNPRNLVPRVEPRVDVVKEVAPNTCLEFVEEMTRLRAVCAAQGWAPVYHYTQPQFGSLIVKTGFRMSTQGQGDGGVYFSTKGPCSYGLGSQNYEQNIIMTALVKVDSRNIEAKTLSPAPGGRDNAVMVRKSDFEALTLPHFDGNYFLSPDRIVAMIYLQANVKLKGILGVRKELNAEVDKDTETRLWLSQVHEKLQENETDVNKLEMLTEDVAEERLSTSSVSSPRVSYFGGPLKFASKLGNRSSRNMRAQTLSENIEFHSLWGDGASPTNPITTSDPCVL